MKRRKGWTRNKAKLNYFVKQLSADFIWSAKGWEWATTWQTVTRDHAEVL